MRAGITAILIATFAWNTFGVGLAATSSPRAARASGVAGIVVDINEARIVGASIRIENADFKKVVRSDTEGRFEIEVPPGSYELTVEQSGFRKFHLPGFRVDEGTWELVNIHLEVAPPKMPVKI